MSVLIVGPSNAGKSTYISQAERGQRVHYAFELRNGGVPEAGVVHYNLLCQAAEFESAGNLPGEWDLTAEPIFARLLSSGLIERAVVIVAPIHELASRAAARRVIELGRDDLGKYAAELWSNILQRVDLFALYERLFDALEESRTPFVVLYSSASMGSAEPMFLPSDRVNAHHNLRGLYLSTPSQCEIDEVAALPGTEYQSVLLPEGRLTAGYSHVAGGRSDTFSIIRDRCFRGRSVLDVGCALGDMLFRAERLGATRLEGIELREGRFKSACRIGHLLKSRANFQFADFLKIDLKEQFDDVLLLNVLHHVADFRSFILKAAALAKERLIIEYPTLSDPRFQSLSAFSESIQHLPIVGVSGSNVDQTFVYTSSALERIAREAGNFRSEVARSPIDHREILFLHRV